MINDSSKEYPLSEWLEIVRLAVAEGASEYQFRNGLQRVRVILGMEAGHIPSGEVFVFVEKIRKKIRSSFTRMKLEEAATESKNGNLPKAIKLLQEVVVSIDFYNVD